MTKPARQLAVLGSPISHTRSPALHSAAYRVLGLDWHYGSADVTGPALGAFISSRDSSWRGLSLTMPLKRDVVPLLDWRDDLVAQTGSANTVLFEDGLRGFNTDVYGITESFRESGHERPRYIQILGGGATAASVIAAAAVMDSAGVHISTRSPEKSLDLLGIGALLGVGVTLGPLAEAPPRKPDTVVNTLPNGVDPAVSPGTAVLLDVSYDPWPTALATRWNGPVIGGLEMLVHQAIAQVRVFVNGDPGSALENESAVLAAMRAAAGL